MRVHEQWVMYVAMQVVAAAIGYLTKRAAIEMMFRPLTFIGIKGTIIGWQGVVPRHAGRMIRIASDLLTTQLVHPREIFAKIDPARLVREVEASLLTTMDEITRQIMARHHPQLWELLPPLVKDIIVKQVQAGAPVL